MLAPPKLKLSLSLVGSKTITGSMLLLHQSQHFFTTFRYLFGPSQDFHCSSLKLPSRHRFKGSSKVCKGFSKAIKGSSKVFSKVLQRFFFKGVSIWIKGFSKGFHQFSEVCPLSSELWSSPLGHREPSAKGSAGSARRPRASQSDDTEYGMQCAHSCMCNMQYAVQCAMYTFGWNAKWGIVIRQAKDQDFNGDQVLGRRQMQVYTFTEVSKNVQCIQYQIDSTDFLMFQCSKIPMFKVPTLIVLMFKVDCTDVPTAERCGIYINLHWSKCKC